MKKTIWEKRIPTLLGMMLILIGIVTTSFMVGQETNFLGFASPLNTPENIRFTNISDASFTVSYITVEKTTGLVSFGTTEALGTTVLDEEDEKTKNVTSRNTHVISVKNLKPLTTYYFKITNNDTTFLNNGKPFTLVTGPAIKNESDKPLEISGAVLFPNSTISEALLYVSSSRGQSLVTRVNPNGIYKLSLPSLRTDDLGSHLILKDTDILTMLVVGSSMESHITLFANQVHPVPTIILSKNYDFTLTTSPIATYSATVNFPSFSATHSALQTPQITSPKKNEALVDQKPIFKGVGVPGAKVDIEIHSDEGIKTTVAADNRGTWTFRPTNPLSSGLHTITITTRDAYGILKTITQSFTVYAQGTQVNQSATPSASVTPATTPLPTQSPNPSVIPTLTSTPTPTQVSTFIPSITPSALQTQQIEAPGNSLFLPLGLGAITMILSGAIILFLSRGGIL